MKSKKSAILLVFLTVFFSLSAMAQKLNPDEIIKKHLDSIGKAEVRAAIKNRIMVGSAVVKFITQKNLTSQGRLVLASSGDKLFMGMNLNAVDYPSERFIYDGKNAKVDFVRTGTRSILGNFVLSNKKILEESLFGGALFTSWAFMDLNNNDAKLSFDGTKKIGSAETYVIGYSPKGGSDFEIKLYFEKDTSRHIRTEYKRIASASMGRTIDESARQSESRIKVVENFADFKTENGLTLPHTYTINYSITGQSGTNEIEWNFALNEFAFNQKLDEKTFDTNE